MVKVSPAETETELPVVTTAVVVAEAAEVAALLVTEPAAADEAATDEAAADEAATDEAATEEAAADEATAETDALWVPREALGTGLMETLEVALAGTVVG